MKAIRGLKIEELFNWKNGNLGFTLLGVFYLIFPWFASGVLNTMTAIFGMMFLSIAILRARPSVSVLGALMVAFLGISYTFGSIAFLPVALIWTYTIVLFAIFLVFEFQFLKFGPSTSSAKGFAIVPLSLLSFNLILAFIGKNPTLAISWNQGLVAINYLAILLFSFVSMCDLGGWKVMGSSTDKWILAFAILAVATAFLGTYQGTLFQWSTRIFLLT